MDSDRSQGNGVRVGALPRCCTLAPVLASSDEANQIPRSHEGVVVVSLGVELNGEGTYDNSN